MKFSAVILAGGASQRMGHDKSWLVFEGRSLLERQVRLARTSGAEEVVISGRPGVDYSSLGCPVLLDRAPACGPLGGIEAALGAVQSQLLLVLAVDMPFLKLGLLERLLANCGEQWGAVPLRDGKMEPLVAFYPVTARVVVAQLIQQKRYAARDVASECVRLGLVKTVAVAADEAPGLANWNSPEDIRGLCRD